MRNLSYPAIIRTSKLRSWEAVGSSAAHTWRTMPVAHANQGKTHLNENWRDVKTPVELRQTLETRLLIADQKSKTPVLAIEYLITAPHAAFQENGGPVEWRNYFEDALAWIEERHGRDNVVAVNIQLDEITPHMVAYVCPLAYMEATTRKRSVLGKKDPLTGQQQRELREYKVPEHIVLSADHYLGSREKMILMQSDFAEKVGSRHGLRRGVERSALKHVDLKQYHDAVMRGGKTSLKIDPDLLQRKGGLLSRETPEQVAARLVEVLQAQVAPLAAQAATAELDRRRAEEWKKTAENAQADRYREIEKHRKTRLENEKFIGGLSLAELEKVRQYRLKCLAQREEERKKLHAEKQKMQAKHVNKIVASVRYMTAEQVVDLSDSERRALWQEMIKHDALEPELERLMSSGLFEPDGALCRVPMKRESDENLNLFQVTPTTAKDFGR
ncbi:hypothetical protein HNO52_04975 [Billgrantia diversa]|uniref:MobV family relaxase n=1 Tax=Halomonas sp. MCCC 1A13316 TaxID=2733487 RepID=UPI0018A4DA4F|nr:MobV family relaxase [Halomonas sp. MCCC 1A13316]QOR37928.1 hypothetical protein HNO52_04975 [Halomonas sp. MCCC 1A13316]